MSCTKIFNGRQESRSFCLTIIHAYNVILSCVVGMSITIYKMFSRRTPMEFVTKCKTEAYNISNGGILLYVTQQFLIRYQFHFSAMDQRPIPIRWALKINYPLVSLLLNK
jgi:hypothetical protein